MQPGYAVDGVEHLAHGEHAPGHREAEQLDLGDGLGAVRLALFAERAALHAAHAAGEVDRRGQRSGRVLVVVDVRKEFARVQVAAEAAGGSHDGHAALHELLAHEVDEDGALADDVFVHRLLQADGDGLHLADAHAAVGEEALEHGHQLAHLVKERLVAHGYAAAAGEAELARGEWLFQSCWQKAALKGSVFTICATSMSSQRQELIAKQKLQACAFMLAISVYTFMKRVVNKNNIKSL